LPEGGDETMRTSTKWMLAGAGAVGAAAAVGMLGRRPSYSFRDKAVFLTGGARGLGFLMAERLAEEGARLMLVSRNGDQLREAAQKLREKGAQVTSGVCDVRNQQEITEAIETCVEVYGRIDVLINNAGIIQVGPFENMRVADFQDAMDTHAWGPLYAILAALPHMRRQGGGRIVNISSIGGKISVPHLMPYSMSKFALAALSDGMRVELSKYGIIVTSVYPGLMRTGSHVYAHSKGNSEREFGWFSLMATTPGLAINAGRAAGKILEAVRKGSRELVITPQAKLAVMTQGVAPGVVSMMSELINNWVLPNPVGADDRLKAA
jgi:NAD(P)-dependent dehydrogenase (short-subunit alcohol dehydrogenase family)